MNLRTARRIADLTQEQLAKKADVDQTTISAIERGTSKNPSWETVARLARALNIEPEELFPVPDRDDAAAVNQ